MSATSQFQQMVKERGAALRRLSFADLRSRAKTSAESVTLGWRRGSIAIIVEERSPDAIRVVIQGFLRVPFLPGARVALDGFYKHADGTLTAMSDREFYEFD